MRSTKRTGDCGDNRQELEQIQLDTLDYNRNYGWRYGDQSAVKKFFRRILAPLVSIYHRLKIISRKISRGWRGGPAHSGYRDWQSRTALLAAIVLGVAFIANGSMNRELLLFGGSTLRSGEAAARSVFNSSVGLLSSVGRIAYLRSGSVASSSNWSHKESGTRHTDSAKVASSSSSSRVNDLLGLPGTHHTIDGLAGMGPKSSNHSGGTNKKTAGGLASSRTTSGTGGASHGGGATASIKAGTGTKTLSGGKTPFWRETSSGGTLATSSDSTGRGGAVASGPSGSSLAALAVDGDISWTGATSTAWNTTTNWSPTGVPTGTDNAVFNSAFSNQPTLTMSETVGGLWMTDPVGQDVLVGGANFLLSLTGNTINGNTNLGILVDNSSAYELTIACNTRILNSQSWTNNSSNLLTINGGVDLNHKTLTVSGSGNTLINGIINGGLPSSSLTKSGSGTLTLTGKNTYQGTTQVLGGTLLVNGNQSTAHGDVTVSGSGTTLGGTGTIGGDVTVGPGANIAPGNGGNTTGTLSTGALTLQPGSNFLVDINGTTPGTGYDQLNVNGTVTLTNSNLMVTVGGTINVGDTFTIINNDGTDTVVGMFAQGSTVTGSNGDVFTINYAGGTGNDVVLTAVTVTPEPSTWIGGALAVAALAYTQRRRLLKLILLRRAYGGQAN